MPYPDSRLDANQQHIYFITGKGGVGKSTVALALALKLKEQGFKTLLVEMNAHSYFQRVLGTSITHTPTEIQSGLWAANWQAETCLREYVLHYLKLEKLYQLFFQNRVMRAFLDIAPGLSEISILGKITSGIRKIGPPLNFDRIVVDVYSTGHARAFFRAPQGLAQAVQVGPMGEQSRAIDQLLRDPRYCSYWIVTLLEELPATEALEQIRDLQTDLGRSAQLLCNRVVPQVRTEPVPAGLQNFLNSFVAQSAVSDKWRQYLQKSGAPLAELPFFTQVQPLDVAHSLTKVLPL